MGKNPYTVNVITFSGHGITHEGDAIAVIPQFGQIINLDNLGKDARFINMSGIARKFAQKNYSINIFLMSMCRNFANVKEQENEEDIENSAQAELYKHLKADALGTHRCVGYKQNGISIMLFGCQEGKQTTDGKFIELFFKKYTELKDTSENVGWDLI